MPTAEHQRLRDHYAHKEKWLHWGPYLSERQWGTVREDYSPHGSAWDYFPHDHARSRQYRWGEDGLAGISDLRCQLCFAVGLWNGQDTILKERLFGLTGPQGNHGEDVKELYYYLDNTPTHSYQKYLYKYPQRAFPYDDLLHTNQQRGLREGEYELLDTGVFAQDRYFDVLVEYAKATPEDILIRISIHNRGPEKAPLTVLPTLWFRNQWSYRLIDTKPNISIDKEQPSYHAVVADHVHLGKYYCYFEPPERLLFTENETNAERIFGLPNDSPQVKDAFHDAVINGDYSSLERYTEGTKCAPVYALDIGAGEAITLHLRLTNRENLRRPFGAAFDRSFEQRIKEADAYYADFIPEDGAPELAQIQRQAFAGMLWTKQFYYFDINLWLDGDPGQPPPPPERKNGRNSDWRTLNNADIISMPDKWEYPWYAAWDLAFHCVPLAMLDPDFAKHQLILFLREWYMRPNGQIPAYEWAFSDVNPPVHAWACMEVYRIDKDRRGEGDLEFLKRVFQKLLINFTWWVNRKDHNENNIFEGGFLGLDNIGVFDRSAVIPGGGVLEQADGTSWMAMFCLNMLDIALEIAPHDKSYEDVATKFFEHFVHIADALNYIGFTHAGAWDEEEGFFYDVLAMPDGRHIPIKVRSLVGLTTLFASLVIPWNTVAQLPDFLKRMRWYRDYRLRTNQHPIIPQIIEGRDILLSLTPRDRLERILSALLDPEEFLSPGGIRSVSKIHQDPYNIQINGENFTMQYEPGESTTPLFGGNSNWRGPIWMPMNYLLIRSLQEFYVYYGEDLKVACPTGSKRERNLSEIATDLSNLLISIFKPDENGRRPVHGNEVRYQQDPHFKDLILFFEYFHGDHSCGIGASHQTGWTGVVAHLIDAYGWYYQGNIRDKLD